MSEYVNCTACDDTVDHNDTIRVEFANGASVICHNCQPAFESAMSGAYGPNNPLTIRVAVTFDNCHFCHEEPVDIVSYFTDVHTGQEVNMCSFCTSSFLAGMKKREG